jgi:hypothetical protein
MEVGYINNIIYQHSMSIVNSYINNLQYYAIEPHGHCTCGRVLHIIGSASRE